MKPIFSPKNNPRVIIIQILYGKYYNNDQNIIIPKHRFKKFIKDVVFGTIERNEVIIAEIKKIVPLLKGKPKLLTKTLSIIPNHFTI